MARGPALVFPLQIYSINSPMQVVDFSPSLSSALACRALHQLSGNDSAYRILVASSFVNMAQIVRAILLAKAIATSILGFRIRSRASHEPSGIDLRPSQFNRDIAPIFTNLRISACPALETRPNRSLPPEECCWRTRPSQAARSLPLLKHATSGEKTSTASAMIGPTPEIVSSRRLA
nr:hypothetical protein [Sneathiella sp. HT1-7]